LLIKYSDFSQINIEKISNIYLSLDLTNAIRSKIIDIVINNQNCNYNMIIDLLAKSKINKINAFLDFISSNKLIENLDQDTFLELIEDYESQFVKMRKLKKIEELEKSFSSNMNEQAFNELISLKNSNNL